jgi:hypothetical protein
MMKKKLLMSLCICAVVLLVIASLTNVVGYQSVKATVNDSLLVPITQKIKWDKQEQKIKSIFDVFKEKISTATTQEECKLVFQESLIELEKHGFLGDLNADEAYKIIDDSYTSGNSYSVYGESSQTLFLERIGVFFYELSKRSKNHIGLFLSYYFLFYNRNHLVHIGSYLTFGKLYYCETFLYDANPAEGYVKIVGPSGETEYNDSFFGQLERINPPSLGDPDISVVYCIGIKGFQGILINKYYFGTAKEVGIGIDAPDQ